MNITQSQLFFISLVTFTVSLIVMLASVPLYYYALEYKFWWTEAAAVYGVGALLLGSCSMLGIFMNSPDPKGGKK